MMEIPINQISWLEKPLSASPAPQSVYQVSDAGHCHQHNRYNRDSANRHGFANDGRDSANKQRQQMPRFGVTSGGQGITNQIVRVITIEIMAGQQRIGVNLSMSQSLSFQHASMHIDITRYRHTECDSPSQYINFTITRRYSFPSTLNHR